MSPSTSTWKVGRVDSVAQYVTVGFVGSQAAHHVDSGIPLLRGQNVRPYRIDMSNLKYINGVTHEKWSKSALSAGDVVIVRVGYPGTAAVIPEGLGDLNAASLVIVRPDQARLSADYFVSVLNSPWGKAMVESRFVGSAQQVLNAGAVAALEIPLPDIQVQRQIASVLHAYDELIENNARRIEILEEMAQAIYREWFVEFRYPGHEDAPLVDSELGPIPEGWTCPRVDELAEVVRGRSYRKFEVPETGGVPFLNLKCMSRGGGFRKSGLKRYTGPFKPSQQAHSGDIVMAVTDMTQERNVVARAARVPLLPEGWGVISLDLARVVPQGTDREYLYGMFRYSSFPEHVKNYASGTNVLHLSAERICEYKFPCADSVTQERYGSIVRPIFDMIDQLHLQCEVLQETRDLLLPRLISGEIDVSGLDIELAGSSV